MILLIHKDEIVIEVVDLKTNQSIPCNNKKPIKALLSLGSNYKTRILIWCHESLKDFLNIKAVKAAMYLKNTMLSYSGGQYLLEQIGYVEDSPFLKVNKHVRYPTWLMSSEVGAIYGSQLLKFENIIKFNDTFSFSLNSIAKLGISKGLLCYSEPKLLKKSSLIKEEKASIYKLFKFVKQHYKGIWSILLLVNFIINERKYPFLSFFRTFFIKKLSPSLSFDLEPIESELIKEDSTVDIIIPTLGRKAHVHNFLMDLSNQSLLPKQVIIVEQNDAENSKTDLDFILNKTWPFKIRHKFINQTGACNARNIGLTYIDSNYVFLADDDIRVNSSFIESTLSTMQHLQFPVVTLSCLREKDVKQLNTVMQWSAFGSGCSFVKANHLKNILFDIKYEFGYGEDIDFGMQLRNRGTDIIYLPFPEIKHLKAPIGGFRTKFVHPWEKDELQPKPSPTVMLNRTKNTTTQQLLGYRTRLFFKFYKSQSVKNPFNYLRNFRKQWQISKVWANHLNKEL